MRTLVRRLVACVSCLVLSACGGGDSTTTKITGGGINDLGQSPAVSLPFVQRDNNLQVQVSDGPHGFQLSPNANILYATVTICEPGNTSNCQMIDHVQVDTGSVGLRVLASKVKSLNLPSVGVGTTDRLLECFQFVVGGLWGPVVGADVVLGAQTAHALPLQLIVDDPSDPVQSTSDCNQAAGGAVLSSAAALGSNGILGIGSTTLDCGATCLDGLYANTSVQYYSCPQGATSNGTCTPAAVPANLQVYNPVAALPTGYNNGVVLRMPAVSDPGAVSATGELVLGIDTAANNTRPAAASKVYLGVDYLHNPNGYLNVNTDFDGISFAASYLDTGTNGLFFTDGALAKCAGSPWYCATSRRVTASISDGDMAGRNALDVSFQLGNAEALFSTSNTAFASLAGDPGSSGLTASPLTPKSFAWGMPFFYGKQVFLSIWQQAGSMSGPWYAWAPL